MYDDILSVCRYVSMVYAWHDKHLKKIIKYSTRVSVYRPRHGHDNPRNDIRRTRETWQEMHVIRNTCIRIGRVFERTIQKNRVVCTVRFENKQSSQGTRCRNISVDGNPTPARKQVHREKLVQWNLFLYYRYTASLLLLLLLLRLLLLPLPLFIDSVRLDIVPSASQGDTFDRWNDLPLNPATE